MSYIVLSPNIVMCNENYTNLIIYLDLIRYRKYLILFNGFND